MEEQNFNEIPEEVPEIYVPRPTWQVWLARTGLVIMAIGTSPNPLLRATTPGLETNARGCIITEEQS